MVSERLDPGNGSFGEGMEDAEGGFYPRSSKCGVLPHSGDMRSPARQDLIAAAPCYLKVDMPSLLQKLCDALEFWNGCLAREILSWSVLAILKVSVG
jgi:hypothetical protein